MRTFAGVDLSVEAVPDATTLLKFRHLLEAHDLTRQIFVEVGALLSERKLLMREGTIVDATIIAAPSSTQNTRKQRDLEMHQTRKGHQWYFGMKAHIGVDAQSGLVHSLRKPATLPRPRCAPPTSNGPAPRPRSRTRCAKAAACRSRRSLSG